MLDHTRVESEHVYYISFLRRQF